MATRRIGRLFWKLLLALWLSMVLSFAGTLAYITLMGRPPLPDGDGTFGFVPFVPLISAMAAVLIIGPALAWYLSRPLRHLRWALRRAAEGRFDTRVQPLMDGRRDEIADLAQEFDSMASQLQHMSESRQVLLHDISHELRSPLSRLQAAIGLLRQDPSQTEAMVERIQRESDRLDVLIEELLTLHRLEAPAGLARETVDVIELLHAIAEDADFEARPLMSRQVHIDAPGQFVVRVNGELLYRAFENVIRNAVKYTAPGTVVEIHAAVSAQSGQLVTTVQDRGPGVPAAMLRRIFDPFTRVEGGESVRGVGLGLAIALRSMELHGGRIQASLRDGGGLVMTLWLPATPDPTAD
ncbi:HAMP domain-containing protein [Acidovorax sp. SUPP1855]|uniref:HAMP domain-containing sensor histidine kinase n=1 Tax=Acidovorax sp. SUPP1855 TaxID=431774 RepID=UPI0023DE4423|nr:ATP-binding protein [Acidovorax sp. SUPP1855]GKS86206.1 HAMP domain-containing protein [Acidovorax sp. SUPP1855]